MLGVFRDNRFFSTRRPEPDPATIDPTRPLTTKQQLELDKKRKKIDKIVEKTAVPSTLVNLKERMAVLRQRALMDYESARCAAARNRLNVGRNALRSGLLQPGDRPIDEINVRKLPRSLMLSGYSDDEDEDEDEDGDGKDGRGGGGRGSGGEWDGDGSRRRRKAAQEEVGWKTGTVGNAVKKGGKWFTGPDGKPENYGEGDLVDDYDQEYRGPEGGWRTGRRAAVGRYSVAEDNGPSDPNRFWPGYMLDKLRLHRECELGGHPIFVRARQSWGNADERFAAAQAAGSEAAKVAARNRRSTIWLHG